MDDATTAYIEGRASPAEFDAVSRDLGESAERERDIEELRRTVALLRSVETPPAPRSFALTPDMVPQQQRAWRLDLSYAPAAAAAVLILAIGVLIAGDLTDLFRQSELGAVAESAVEMAAVQQESAPAKPAAATAAPAPAMQMKVVETVVVEKAVTTVEKVIETVVVEKPVTRTEKVVEKVVEEEAETAEMVVATVVVEKQVASEETVEKPVAMQAGQDSGEAVAKEEIEINETPAGAMLVEAESIDDSPAPTAEPTPQPTATPMPTPTPMPRAEPTASATPGDGEYSKVFGHPAAPGIPLPLWQLEVLLAALAVLMLALWAVLRRRSGRNRR